MSTTMKNSLLKDDDKQPVSREEATEAALTNATTNKIENDVCVVVVGSVTGNLKWLFCQFSGRFTNLLWFPFLKEKEVPPLLQGMDPHAWAAFRRNISDAILMGYPSLSQACKAFALLVTMAVLAGIFLAAFEDSVGPTLFPLLVIVTFVVVLAPWYKTWQTRERLMRQNVRKVVNRMAPALEKQGYWITLVDANGWAYVQFTKCHGHVQTSKDNDDIELGIFGRTKQEASPYTPEDWMPLEGAWEMVATSKEVRGRQNCLKPYIISETLHFQGTQSEETVSFKNSGTARILCLTPRFDLTWERKGNTFQLRVPPKPERLQAEELPLKSDVSQKQERSQEQSQGQDKLGHLFPITDKARAAGCGAVHYNLVLPGAEQQVIKVEGSKMTFFLFPYLDCPSDDMIHMGALDKDDFEFWESYERTTA